MRRPVPRLLGGMLLAILSVAMLDARVSPALAAAELDLSLQPWDVTPPAGPVSAPAVRATPTRPPFRPATQRPGVKIQPYVYDTRQELSATGRARAERTEPELGQGKVERKLQDTGVGVRLISPF